LPPRKSAYVVRLYVVNCIVVMVVVYTALHGEAGNRLDTGIYRRPAGSLPNGNITILDPFKISDGNRANLVEEYEINGSDLCLIATVSSVFTWAQIAVSLRLPLYKLRQSRCIPGRSV